MCHEAYLLDICFYCVCVFFFLCVCVRVRVPACVRDVCDVTWYAVFVHCGGVCVCMMSVHTVCAAGLFYTHFVIH